MTPTESHFAFRVGNDNDPGTWQAAPATASFGVQPGAGPFGSTRVTVTWPDGAITNQWLEVTISSAVIGLSTDDVFYFGNAIGETGSDSTSTLVNATDVIGVRDNPHGLLNLAPIADPYDFNRDQRVDAVDMIVARDHATSPLTALRLITPPPPAPTPPELGEGATGASAGQSTSSAFLAASTTQAEPLALLAMSPGTIGGVPALGDSWEDKLPQASGAYTHQVALRLDPNAVDSAQGRRMGRHDLDPRALTVMFEAAARRTTRGSSWTEKEAAGEDFLPVDLDAQLLDLLSLDLLRP
jgi:hypothetical protein